MNEQASARNLDLAVTSLLDIEPDTFKDPKFAVDLAERLVALTHHNRATFLLDLARAYQASGKSEEATMAAKDGLALLPPLQPGEVVSRLRAQLEAQARSTQAVAPEENGQ